MKKLRLLALLLALLMVFAMLAGCSKDTGSSKDDEDDEEEEVVELKKGAYEVYDEDEELVAYLNVSRHEIVVYDEDGEEDDTYEYEYDEDEEVYLVDDEEAFTMEEDKDGLWLVTWEDEDRYLLEEIDEEDIPGFEGGENDTAADEGGTAAGVETPAAGEETPAAGEEADYAELDPWGTYAVLEDGDEVAYIDMWDGEADLYELDGSYETVSYEIDRDGTYVVYDEDGDEYMSFVVMEVRGELRMCNPDDTDEYYVLEMISQSDLPQGGTSAPAGGATTGQLDLWGTYEMITEDGINIGYLDLWETSIRVYDLDGTYEVYDLEVMDNVYLLWDEDGDLFDSLAVEVVNGQLWAETNYDLRLRLETMDYSDLPSGSETTTTTGTAAEELDTWGCYEVYQDGQLVGYMDFWGDVMYLYPNADSSENYECSVSYENGVWVLKNSGNDVNLEVVDEVVNGQLRIYEPGDPNDYLVLVLMDYSDFPY